MDIVNLENVKIIHVTATNLNDVIFTIEVNERYFTKGDECRDLESGLEFIVIDRPYTTLQGKCEIRCKLLTRINSLRFIKNERMEMINEPGYVTYKGKVKDERTEV
jgi:hypothetical protein